MDDRKRLALTVEEVELRRCAFVSYAELDLMGGHRTHILGFAKALARQSDSVMLNPTPIDAATDSPLEYVQIIYPQQRIPFFSYSNAILSCLSGVHRQKHFDFVYLRSVGGYRDLVTLLWARMNRLPLTIEVNGLLHEEYAALTSDVRQSVRQRISLHANLALLGVNYRLADRVVAVTSNIRDYLVKHHGVLEPNIRVFSNGVDTELFHPMERAVCKSELGLPTERRYIGFVGTLMPWQGVDDLITAFHLLAQQHIDWHLLIVGARGHDQIVAKLVSELAIDDRVTFTGQVDHRTVVKYINACDVVVVPKKPLGSGYSPMKIYEYLACGRPVVASHLPGLEFVQSAGVGVTFRAGDPNDLAKAITELMGLEPVAWHSVGVKARRLAVELYSWDKIVREIVAFAVGNEVSQSEF